MLWLKFIPGLNFFLLIVLGDDNVTLKHNIYIPKLLGKTDQQLPVQVSTVIIHPWQIYGH